DPNDLDREQPPTAPPKVPPPDRRNTAIDEGPRIEPRQDLDVKKLPPVSPEASAHVFIDVTSYNSKFYYVQGDVANPGRIPCSGRETVLDAIIQAGGLITTADPTQIRLVRPAQGGKPKKIYLVDLRAIIEEGESRLNYQLFPGDRVVVGRH